MYIIYIIQLVLRYKYNLLQYKLILNYLPNSSHPSPYSMNVSLNNSTVSDYKNKCQRIISNSRFNSTQHSRQNDSKQIQRLSFKDIQNITKIMLKDKKAHQHNIGVLQNIKGKLYCLKLGQVSNFKQFSHYFYTSQYRRKISKPDSQIQRKYNFGKSIKKITTQSCENMPFITKDLNQSQFTNQEEIKNLQNIDLVEGFQFQFDNKLKDKINKFMLPVLTHKEQKQKQQHIEKDKENKRQTKKNQKGRRYSVSRML